MTASARVGKVGISSDRVGLMRIALLGSPRCGNNWVRRVMSDVLGYPHFAAHSVGEFPKELPPDCILNIHAPNEPLNNAFFERHLCKIIVLARHPLDIFVSVLQFARNERAVHKWLDGSCQIPYDAASLCPDDARFVDWMTGAGAKRLLSVSLSWWQCPESIRLQYEDLVERPQQKFNSIFDCLGTKCAHSLDAALDKYTVAYFAEFKNHGWLGRPETYRKVITSPNCERVVAAQVEYFMNVGYSARGDDDLSHERAREQYFALLPPASGSAESNALFHSVSAPS
jgi:hypothetical protein